MSWNDECETPEFERHANEAMEVTVYNTVFRSDDERTGWQEVSFTILCALAAAGLTVGVTLAAIGWFMDVPAP